MHVNLKDTQLENRIARGGASAAEPAVHK